MPHVRTRLGLSPKQMDCPLLLPQTHTQLSEIDNQTILNKIDSLLDSMDVSNSALISLFFFLNRYNCIKKEEEEKEDRFSINWIYIYNHTINLLF